MALITLKDAQLAYGHVALLDHADFALESAERIGLIGRNGTGKSSLLRILAGSEQADDGTLHMRQGLRIALVPQDPVLPADATVFDAVAEGLELLRSLIDRHARAEGDLGALHARIEALGGWDWERRVAQALQHLSLARDARVGTLSGGTQKRVALARALVAQPDVLLLDEPTNHLDLDAIEWLEELLLAWPGSAVAISHDRAFLDRIATRIVELDRGRLRSYPGNFARYQALKDEQLAHEAVVDAKADRLLAQEEAWVRQGVEARRTRSASRVARLERLRERRAQRRSVLGSVAMDVAAGQRSGKIVAELGHVSKSFAAADGTPLPVVRDFSAILLRGDKVGLVGANGAGKTTLLKLILGETAPDTGTVRRGSRLEVAYFDQMRGALDPDASLEHFISPGSEWIEIGNQRKHVRSYLGDFLFSAERAGSPVRSLSGGERNRLLLARLFARPASVLVLDEPTNDLDIDTLELLERLLQDYAGTVFVVSHDRAFLDNVVTSLIAAEGGGRWREYEGGIADWLEQRARAQAAPAGPAPRPDSQSKAQKARYSAPAKESLLSKQKRSHKEQRELDALPQRIAALEAEQKSIQEALADGSLYASDHVQAQRLSERSAQIEDELMAALERWETLEAR